MVETSYSWLMGCIVSCTNIFQLECCYKLLGYFRDMYDKEKDFVAYMGLLKDAYDSKEISISLTA